MKQNQLFPIQTTSVCCTFPHYQLSKPDGIILYTKVNPSLDDVGNIEKLLASQIREMKMLKLNIDQKLLDSLKTTVSINTVKLSEGGQEKSSNSGILFGIGMAGGILMYMFIFIYGAQIMQGIIEEKSSKVVEVIVSSVKPFQLMMGKIIGLASVGLLQFFIWIVLMSTLTFGVLGYFGSTHRSSRQCSKWDAKWRHNRLPIILRLLRPLTKHGICRGDIFCSLFFSTSWGGYLIYGALFAAVGSAVDSPAEAQQFMFPITIPLLISYMSLFMFILQDPHGTVSIWLSIIPFTSPIAMMGRIGFEVPIWQLALSMILLIGGFMLTTWVAGRIYRVGILMHGTKVSFKVMAKWFMQRG